MILFIRDCIDNFIVCGYVRLDSDFFIGVRWYLSRLCVLFCDKLVFLNVVKYVLMVIIFVLIYINSCCIKIEDKSYFIIS